MRRRDLVFVPAGLMLVAVLVARGGEVIAHGRLLPFFETYEVDRVRVLGAEVYVDSSTGLDDVLTALVLAAAAAILLGGWARLRVPPADTFFTAALGAVFLALDDVLSAHETIGHNLGFLADLPLIDHPDDLLVGAYGVAIAGFAYRHRDVIGRIPRPPAVVAVAAGAAAVLHDLSPLHLRRLEEGLEVVAAAALLVAIHGLVRREVALANS